MASKLRVGFDARMWDHPGIGRYIREIVGALSATGRVDFIFLAPFSCQEAIRRAAPGSGFVEATSAIYTLSEQLELRRFSSKAPLLHVPHFNIPYVASGRLVVTIHDLIYLKSGGHARSPLGPLYVRALLHRAAKKASRVITVSDFTRQDLLRLEPSLAGRVRVIHEAASPVFLSPAAPKRADAEYFLYVGSLKRHKNVARLAEAFVAYRRRAGSGIELWMAGRTDPKERQLNQLLSGLAKDGVRLLGEVRDEELPGLYAGAKAFILPSLWEGFGLPVLEAMSQGTPVLLSRSASLPEVGADAALYFDAEDAGELSRQMERIAADDRLRKSLSEEGRRNILRFSWEKAATETLRVYEEALA